MKAVNFDLQKVLITPKGSASDFYYSLKLATYNLTVYDMASRQANCYMWNESIAKRGSCEIASCLYSYCASLPSLSQLSLFSDSCTGRQRNILFTAMCLYCVSNMDIQTITHTYFERGHSQMEGDNVHFVIERATKHADIYSPEEWVTAVRMAKKNIPTY